jgi:hypothetical protein
LNKKIDGIAVSACTALFLGAFGDKLAAEKNGKYVFEKSFSSLPDEKVRFILGL